MKNPAIAQYIRRGLLYTAGLVSVSLGIVLCKKCAMGISPISSIPFVLEKIVPISFGMLTTLFHFVNTVIQMILQKTVLSVRLWLQFLLAFVFGQVIDFINGLIRFDGGVLLIQILFLILSVFFTAFGMLLMLDMDLIQNPPDGTVRTIASLAGREVGTIKVFYDITCVVISLCIGLVFLHRIEGFGVATIVSALFVGRTLSVLRKGIGHIPT